MSELRIGRRAPGFSLECVDGNGGNRRPVTLDDYQDGWVALLFYPKDFSMI